MGSLVGRLISGLPVSEGDGAASKEIHLSVRGEGSSLTHSRTVQLSILRKAGNYSESKEMDGFIDGWKDEFAL